MWFYQENDDLSGEYGDFSEENGDLMNKTCNLSWEYGDFSWENGDLPFGNQTWLALGNPM